MGTSSAEWNDLDAVVVLMTIYKKKNRRVIALAFFGFGSWLKRIDLSEVQFCLLGVGATVYQHTVPRARCTVLSSESDYLLGTDFVVARETDLFFFFPF